MSDNEQIGRINESFQTTLETGLLLLQSDGSDDVVKEQGEERDHQEEVDDQPGYEPGSGVLPDGEQEDELGDEEGREEEEQIIQTVRLEVLLDQLPQHVGLAVQESQTDDQGEV